MPASSAASQEKDDARALFNHVPRRCHRRDEIRLHDRRQRHHEFFNSQIRCVFSGSVFFHQRPGGIEHGVNVSSLRHDAIDIIINGSVIESVNHCRARATACRCNLLGNLFNVRFGSPSKENFRTFGGEFFRNSGSNRATGAEYHGMSQPMKSR